ncbi:cystathionine beta-synthase [Diorhabda sublineata]|uniref:cystathionine beta-synthase n=1 Tax=Diorhabda sublineata TaxID=1163346 RepID=UPI0024E1072B|nr:cystathionine beta-synthase [Diorhabda sublineata]
MNNVLENSNQDNIKKIKSGLTFSSPLNDNFNPPDKKSSCTWHKNVDRTTTPHTVHDWRRTSKILPNALAAIGNTPMIKLNRIPQAEGLKCDLYVKCEFFNPGGSVKDRIGMRLIEDAEKQGILKPGSTIIEPSSGNTGIGLALAAAIKGYRCIIVMSEKMSNEKVSVLSALGTEIVRTPVNADSNSAEGMFGMTHKLRKEIPNSVILDQYSNPANPLAHYDTTAEEIYDQCDKEVDMIVMGAGTGGTVAGVGRKFKEISPQTKIVAADPVGSILALPESLNETDAGFYEVEGIGYDFVPTVLDRDVVDIWIKTTDEESLPMARRLIQEEGLLVGSSSGAAVAAAVRAAKHLEAGKKVVVVLPDSIRNYITKFVSDQWMEARNLRMPKNTMNHWWWNDPVTKLNLNKLLLATVGMKCEKVLSMIKKAGIDQIPIVDSTGSMVGMLTLQNLMQGLLSGKVKPEGSIERCLVRIYPKVQKSANLGVVSRILERESYVLVLDSKGTKEEPIGIVTAIDLLQYTQK